MTDEFGRVERDEANCHKALGYRVVEHYAENVPSTREIIAEHSDN